MSKKETSSNKGTEKLSVMLTADTRDFYCNIMSRVMDFASDFDDKLSRRIVKSLGTISKKLEKCTVKDDAVHINLSADDMSHLLIIMAKYCMPMLAVLNETSDAAFGDTVDEDSNEMVESDETNSDLNEFVLMSPDEYVTLRKDVYTIINVLSDDTFEMNADNRSTLLKKCNAVDAALRNREIDDENKTVCVSLTSADKDVAFVISHIMDGVRAEEKLEKIMSEKDAQTKVNIRIASAQLGTLRNSLIDYIDDTNVIVNSSDADEETIKRATDDVSDCVSLLSTLDDAAGLPENKDKAIVTASLTVEEIELLIDVAGMHIDLLSSLLDDNCDGDCSCDCDTHHNDYKRMETAFLMKSQLLSEAIHIIDKLSGCDFTR